MIMNTKSFRKTEDLRHLETLETTECPSAILIQGDYPETIECMAVLLVTTIGLASRGVKSSDMETIGEDCHETHNVDVHSMSMKAMVEEVSEEIVPTMELIVEEPIGISMIVGLESETKATGVVKDIRIPSSGEEVIVIGKDELI